MYAIAFISTPDEIDTNDTPIFNPPKTGYELRHSPRPTESRINGH